MSTVFFSLLIHWFALAIFGGCCMALRGQFRSGLLGQSKLN
jgi:hypothetical protein